MGHTHSAHQLGIFDFISSGHRAKGLEAPNVYQLHPELFPFKRARTEEAKAQEVNLHYVCSTRSKVSLNFVQG